MLNLLFSRKITGFSASLLLAAAALLTGCGGGGGGTTTTTTTTTTTATAASLDLLASPTTVKSDGSTSTTITITALSAANAAVQGVTVSLSANTGVLGSASVITGTAGTATATFSSGSSKINRTATITATAGAASAQIPVQVVGSTVTVNSTGTTLPDDGTLPVTLTITAKDAGGNVVSGAAVTLTKTGTGNVTLTPASGTTDANGQLAVTAAGAAGGAGTVTVSAAALGATATTALTVSPSASTFAIDQQTLNGAIVTGNPTVTAMKIGDSLAVQVNAPTAANVIFATSTGTWNGTGSVVAVPVVAGKATATLTTTQASVASIQVYDPLAPTTSDSLTVAMTSATAASITIQPSPSVISKSVGTTTGSSTLVAMVRDASGFPVGDAPVSFSIVNPTGGGEIVSPVVVLSAATTAGGLSLGEARTSFTSGSLSSGAGGVQVRASVVGTAVATESAGVNLTSSGNDAAIVIGGTAGSVAFGSATVIATDSTNANYVRDMSILVADSNGNPAPLGTVVNLSAWPIAWSTGGACVVDADAANTGTFYNEDVNENLILDAGEDGTRRYYSSGATAVGGAVNGSSTPTNSAGGTLPATVTTDASGVASFQLTYTKGSAIWTITRIRARTVVQGSDAVGEVVFRLDPTVTDADPTNNVCLLPNSPYTF